MRHQSVARLKAELPGVKQVSHDLPPTLADLAANPGEVVASCQNCHHNAVLPVTPVLARYGPATPFPEVKGRFRCSACGSRQVDVQLNWSRHSPGQITRHTNRPDR